MLILLQYTNIKISYIVYVYRIYRYTNCDRVLWWELAAFIIVTTTQCNEVFSVIRKIIEPGWNRSRPQFHILKDRNLVFKKPKKSTRLSSRNFEKQVHRNVSRGRFRKTIAPPTTVMSTAVHGTRLYFISMATAARWRLGWPRRGGPSGRRRTPATRSLTATRTVCVRSPCTLPVSCQRPLGRPFFPPGSLVPVVCGDVSSVFRVLPASLALWPGARHRSIARGLPGERRRCERAGPDRVTGDRTTEKFDHVHGRPWYVLHLFFRHDVLNPRAALRILSCVCSRNFCRYTLAKRIYIYIRHACT